MKSQDSYTSHELQWQFYTRVGNQKMQGSLYQEARQAYEQAMELAQLLLEEAKVSGSHPDAIHPYVVACHNLADSWLNLGNAKQAETILRQSFEQVVQVMSDRALPNLLKLEAFKALKMVSFEIDGFYRKLNQIARAEEVFNRAIAFAQDFMSQPEFFQAITSIAQTANPSIQEKPDVF
jgi:tetratricopeptide (TPR) repeat protein